MHTNPTEEFEIVNQWLGWGEPHDGIWFIGIEEAYGWECQSEEKIIQSREEIKALKGTHYSKCGDKSSRGKLNWPVAVGTAKVAAIANGRKLPEWQEYRENSLWLPGCKVFNGNLLSLGKPSLAHSLPQGFTELFGFGESDYEKYYKNVKTKRFEAFRKLREVCQPRAIVCFGVSHWIDFKELFLALDEQAIVENEMKTEIYEKNRLILTRHFSNGMPDKTLEFIGREISQWHGQT